MKDFVKLSRAGTPPWGRATRPIRRRRLVVPGFWAMTSRLSSLIDDAAPDGKLKGHRRKKIKALLRGSAPVRGDE